MDYRKLKIRNKLYPGKRIQTDTVNNNTNAGGRVGYGVNEELYKSFRHADSVLMDSFNAWTSLEEFRQQADRNKMYVYGDQWGDVVEYEGKKMSERQSIKNQGNIPITNNRLRGMIRTVSGLFQSNQTEPVCIARERDGQDKGEVMSATLQYVYQLNKTWNLDVWNLNNLLISGLAIFRSVYGWRDNKMEIWTDALPYSRVFFDPHMEDVRQWDCHLIGEIEDMSIWDVISRFGCGDITRTERLRSIYSHVDSERRITEMEAYMGDNSLWRDFFIPRDSAQCRVITTWRKEAKDRLLVHDWLSGDWYKVELTDEIYVKKENERRRFEQTEAGVTPEDMKLLDYQYFVDSYWYFYNQAPSGEVLMEGETPYWHGSHPYSFKLYTFYEKQVYPLISGFIDQQRYINRLVTMQDFMMRASSKGVLMVPTSAIEGTGMTPEDFAKEWVKFNGMILYKAKVGEPPPQQIVSNSSQFGVYEMLQMQFKLLEDISGIQGSLQGQRPSSGTPAALYAQQTQNSYTSLSEVLDVYRMLREERDIKTLKLIQQYYDAPRFINSQGGKSMLLYDPQIVRNTEFELSIVESMSSPVYRMVTNEMLLNMLNSGHISIKELLENGAFPFADKLLQSINVREEQMQQMQGGGGMIDPSMLSSVPEDVKNAVDSQSSITF